jgi:hypothetical protein
MRLGAMTMLVGGFVLTAAPGAFASSDMTCPPSWSIRHPDRGGAETTMMLAPGNDSLVNLALLLSETTGQPLVPKLSYPDAHPETIEGPFYDWEAVLPPIHRGEGHQDAAEYSGRDRCESSASGSRAFAVAVQAAGLPGAEQDVLIAARQDLELFCGDPEAVPKPETVTALVKSPAGIAFARYLDAAWAFYDFDDEGAKSRFDALATAAPPAGTDWVRESAAYMQGRLALEQARVLGYDSYGSFHRDLVAANKPATAAAEAALLAYISAYPQGLYRGSASDLLRRVYWLQNDIARLSAAYEQQLSVPAAARYTSDGALVREIDIGLLRSFSKEQLLGLKNPLLLATVDLMQMRLLIGDVEWYCGQTASDQPLTAEALAAQAPLFASRPDLFQMLQATHALYVRNDPQAVLALTANDHDTTALNPVTFTLHMLRGMALAQAGDERAGAYWLALLAQTNAPGQRPLVELSLAFQAQNGLVQHGATEATRAAFAAVFAADSPVVTPQIRRRLLIFMADAALLRQQAQDNTASQREREAALFTLLYKELTRGFYADFIADVALVPADVSSQAVYDMLEGPGRPPLGLFTAAATEQGFACPTLAKTALSLQKNANDPMAQLCIAEFVRRGGLDDFVLEHPPEATVLGGGPSLFPGTGYNRQSTYQQIIANRKAPAAARAYALYRAVKCYAPSSNNGCGGVDVAQKQRKAWYEALKKGYPTSRWAQELKYYW